MELDANLKNLIEALSSLMMQKNGSAYAAGYLESLAVTIAERLGDAEKAALLDDLSKRVLDVIRAPK